jgi:hypothetical protein
VRQGKADEPLSGGGYHPIPTIPGSRNVIPAQVATMIAAPGRRCQLQTPATEELKTPALSVGTRYPHSASRCALCYLPSQHDSDLPDELVTLIDLPCIPEAPGIHLPWTCAATGRAPATTPMHPILDFRVSRIRGIGAGSAPGALGQAPLTPQLG